MPTKLGYITRSGKSVNYSPRSRLLNGAGPRLQEWISPTHKSFPTKVLDNKLFLPFHTFILKIFGGNIQYPPTPWWSSPYKHVSPAPSHQGSPGFSAC